MPDHVHQIGRVLAVVDGKGGIEPDLVGILTQEPSPDAMKRSGPAQCTGYHSGAVAHDQSCDALDTPRHLSGGEISAGRRTAARTAGPWRRPWLHQDICRPAKCGPTAIAAIPRPVAGVWNHGSCASRRPKDSAWKSSVSTLRVISVAAPHRC